MKNNIFLNSCIALLLSACTIQQNIVVKFSPSENEKTISDKLRTFLKTNPNPSIVLRVPGGASNTTATQLDANNQIYNTIEKSLLRNGFIVRDRALFNEVLIKSLESDYSKIYETTKTDLILELVSLDINVKYNTNKYLNKYGEEKIFGCNTEYTYGGASIEFRLILIEDNEFVGSIKINYSPCIEGCDHIYVEDRLFGYCTLYDEKKKQINPQAYESVEFSQLEKFITTSIDQFIYELRK